VEGAVPEAAESANHGWSLTPVKVSVPLPVFVTLMPAGEGLAAPASPAKLKLVGFTASAPTAGFTAKAFTVRATVELLLESALLVAVTFT
jgi:hypothetical protein